MTKKTLKQKAVQMRKEGYSYSIIREHVPVAKSTLSLWVRDVLYTPNKDTANRVRGGFIKSREWAQERKRVSLENAQKSAHGLVQRMTKRDLLMLGIALYIGEGSKTSGHIRIINSDPKVVCLAIKWFKEIFDLKINNFSITIHLYPDNNVEKALLFWHLQTGIPRNQFGRTQVDRRVKKSKKRGMLRYGTAHLHIRSCQDASKGIFLFRKIMAMMDCVLEETTRD